MCITTTSSSAPVLAGDARVCAIAVGRRTSYYLNGEAIYEWIETV